MSTREILDYFESNVYKPFILIVDDDEYETVCKDIEALGTVEEIRISDYCNAPDKRPDLDRLKETLRMIDIDCDTNKALLLGVGEYLVLLGEKAATEALRELLDFNLGSAHVAIPLRHLDNQMSSIVKGDPRLAGRQVYATSKIPSTVEYCFMQYDFGTFDANGIQEALREAEDRTQDEKICANTDLEFPESICQVTYIGNYYEAARLMDGTLSSLSQIGEDEECKEFWKRLLGDLRELSPMESVFTEYDIAPHIDSEFFKKTEEQAYKNWLLLLYVRLNPERVDNAYLNYAASNSSNVDEFSRNILLGITDISPDAEGFRELYRARKKLVANFPQAVIAEFVSYSRKFGNDAIFYLTDNTILERRELVTGISLFGAPSNLQELYPDLQKYLGSYGFVGSGLDDQLTDYFQLYKKGKISNRIDKEFAKIVLEHASNRDFNYLNCRDDIIGTIDKSGSYLCWIDALGAEYTNFIVEYAQERGLLVQVDVGRANLPTITSCNRGFYDQWPSLHKHKIEDLDNLKHKDKGGFSYITDKSPSYLAVELDIIAKAIEEAAEKLSLRECDRYVITGDHGASRLAVLRNEEEKYDTDTQGEHSGRCCRYFEGCDLEYAIDTGSIAEQPRYLVLADYGRFKGSRAANVEVHGGASIEEVVVPVITLSLKDSSLQVSIVDEVVKAGRKEGVSFEVYVNKHVEETISVVCDGSCYACTSSGPNRYRVAIPSIKRKCEKEIDVYLGKSLIERIPIKVVGKSASVNADFDDLF